MRPHWLWQTLYGPSLWAVVFTVIYALHGWGCAADWPEGPHRASMVVLWVLGLGAGAGLLFVLPRRGGVQGLLPHAGAVIGLGATAFTLFPVLFATSCL